MFLEGIIILWIITTMFVSLILCATIHKYISEKPVISLTLVDFIYRDIIVYIDLFSLSMNMGVVFCILSNNDSHTLDFYSALVFAFLTYLFMHCIAISLFICGTLRLISLVKNSEESGIQLLGPDFHAIVKVRWISVVTTILIFTVESVFFSEYPSTFKMFHINESQPISDPLGLNIWNIIYVVIPIASALVNGIAKLYFYLDHSYIKKAITRSSIGKYFYNNGNRKC
jgi:hypothetical protein